MSSEQTVVITGANRGIGLALCNEYLAKGFTVIGLCRKSSPQLQQSGAQVIEGIDLNSAELANTLKAALKGVNIDILINNAGILRDEVLGRINYESIAEQIQTNTLAPLKVCEALLDNLSSTAKIALITSRMGSIADNGSGGRYGYRMSKAALNAAGMSLAKDLEHRGIAVAILHPGYVQTDMVGGRGDIPANICAERLKQRIDDLSLSTSGTFWHSNGEVLPW